MERLRNDLTVQERLDLFVQAKLLLWGGQVALNPVLSHDPNIITISPKENGN